MATDYTNNIAGQYKHQGPTLTCILDEGAPTVVASGLAYDGEGLTGKSLTWTTPIAEGNLVAISNDTACTWVATEGLPVVEYPTSAEILVIGRVVSTPKLVNFPADTAAGDSLIKQLAGGYFRTAVIEIYGGITAILKAEILDTDTSAVLVGTTALLKHNMTSDYADDDTTEIKLVTTTGGTGLIAFHYCATDDAADVRNCLVGITAPLTSLTGA